MEKSQLYAFTSVRQALAFYNYKKPGRIKSINLLEPHSTSRLIFPQFSGLHHLDIHSQVLHSLTAVFRRSKQDERIAFGLYHFGDATSRMHPEDISKLINKSVRQIYRYIRILEDDLELELISRGLLQPEEYDA